METNPEILAELRKLGLTQRDLEGFTARALRALESHKDLPIRPQGRVYDILEDVADKKPRMVEYQTGDLWKEMLKVPLE